MHVCTALSEPWNGSTEYTVSVVALKTSLPPWTVARLPQPASVTASAITTQAADRGVCTWIKRFGAWPRRATSGPRDRGPILWASREGPAGPSADALEEGEPAVPVDAVKVHAAQRRIAA